MAEILKGKGNSLIEGKLSDHLAKLKIEEAENLNVTEWRGKRIAIRNESVRVFLLNFRKKVKFIFFDLFFAHFHVKISNFCKTI